MRAPTTDKAVVFFSPVCGSVTVSPLTVLAVYVASAFPVTPTDSGVTFSPVDKVTKPSRISTRLAPL